MSMFIFICDIAMLLAAENFQEVDMNRAIEINTEKDTDIDMETDKDMNMCTDKVKDMDMVMNMDIDTEMDGDKDMVMETNDKRADHCRQVSRQARLHSSVE
jgi:hypothetical protein